jgi:hypothetical protein
MQYRRLTNDELQELQREFVQFLAANGLPAETWENLKQTSPDQVEALIEQFSDIVFEKALSGVEHLEWRKPREVLALHFTDGVIRVNGIFVEGETILDFTENRPVEEMIRAFQNAAGAKLQLFSAERPCPPDARKREIFNYMQQGALISRNGEMYNLLEKLKS